MADATSFFESSLAMSRYYLTLSLEFIETIVSSTGKQKVTGCMFTLLCTRYRAKRARLY